jgi:hypothetical protein
MSPDLVERAWKRIVLTNEASNDGLQLFFKRAQSVGFLRDATDLSRLTEAP